MILPGTSWAASVLLAATPAPAPPAPAPAMIVEACDASWYGPGFAGRPTASGEIFDPDRLTAAHRDLPFGTVVEVAHGGRTVAVEITDRGPFADVARRCLDLSRAAFEALAPLDAGVIPVEISR